MQNSDEQSTGDFNPDRLVLARKRAGLTKRGLAKRAAISERTIAGYEAREVPPPPAAIEHLASVLGFPVNFFFRADPEPIPERGATWRALSRITAAQRDRALAGGQLALELSDWLEARFVFPTPDIPDLRHQSDAETAAVALRVHWGLGDKPVGNMLRLLEAKGVRVFSLAEECLEVDAFSFWRGNLPLIFLNTVKSAEHSRFDAAHELGHLVLHPHGQPNGRQAEKEANAFAGAFLMPRSSLLAYAPRSATLPDLIRAKSIWKVSPAALAYRMREVGILSAWYYRALCVEIQKFGYRQSEPNAQPRELSLVLEKVFAELRNDDVSKMDVARELGWPLRELNAVVFQLVVAVASGGRIRPPQKKPRTTSELGGLELMG